MYFIEIMDGKDLDLKKKKLPQIMWINQYNHFKLWKTEKKIIWWDESGRERTTNEESDRCDSIDLEGRGMGSEQGIQVLWQAGKRKEPNSSLGPQKAAQFCQ